MRLRQVIRGARLELQAIRVASKISGGRDALIARARHDLDLNDIDTNRISGLESRLLALESARPQLEAQLHITDAHLHETEERLAGRVGSVEDALGNIELSMHRDFSRIDRRGELTGLAMQIDAVTTWVRSAQLATTPRISVILATYNRCDDLRRAIDSVLDQEYPHWELVVVDDGSSDETQALLAPMVSEDERIVVVTQPHRGVGAARNAGLERATGDIICYVDDDNTMQPLWLKAVAWAFTRQPGLEVLYGARVTDVDIEDQLGEGALPFLHFDPFERDRLEFGNYIDLGVLAHLRLLAEAIFDESLKALGDWDLLLRLTVDRVPFPLPVVASIYTTTALNRIGRSGHFAQSEVAIRARLLRERPVRVLAYNSLFPLVCETYIGEEMKALTDNGAVLAWCTDRWAASPVRVVEPIYTDLDAAVNAFEPDVLVLYWAEFAVQRLDALSRIGKPFALRVHSFDFKLETIERVRMHPLCIGTWAYPHHAGQIDGAHDLASLVTTGAEFPETATDRTIVLSVSAGLPKKDWPTLVAAFAELVRKGVDCRIVVGITAEHEDEPDRVRQLILESGESIMLSVDVPHDQVIALLSRTAAVVYTMRPGGPFGMPRSIVEGMYAGTSVILPERPEAALVAGPNCRTYADPEDISRHVIEILAGGPTVESERLFNRRFAESHYADPALATNFAAQLSRAVAQWRAG